MLPWGLGPELVAVAAVETFGVVASVFNANRNWHALRITVSEEVMTLKRSGWKSAGFNDPPEERKKRDVVHLRFEEASPNLRPQVWLMFLTTFRDGPGGRESTAPRRAGTTSCSPLFCCVITAFISSISSSHPCCCPPTCSTEHGALSASREVVVITKHRFAQKCW